MSDGFMLAWYLARGYLRSGVGFEGRGVGGRGDAEVLFLFFAPGAGFAEVDEFGKVVVNDCFDGGGAVAFVYAGVAATEFFGLSFAYVDSVYENGFPWLAE